MLHMPDVPEFQPNVDWGKVKAKNGGAAIIRALYGTAHVDKAWFNGGKDQDAVQQAARFVELVGALHPGEFAILDLEEGDGDQSARAREWLSHVDAKLTYPGYKGAWLYSSESFFKEHGLLPIAKSTRHAWVAAFREGPPPDVPHTLWQHSEKEAWPGIGDCDCSVFDGDVTALLAHIHG
jgi:GH25 family lysozyme M1 (1,4-beta-N-acetylmuramidase)